MAFIRMGSRLANGSRSGAYVYNDGAYVNIHLQSNSAKRRRSGAHLKLTHEELCAIAKGVVERGWLEPQKQESVEEVSGEGVGVGHVSA